MGEETKVEIRRYPNRRLYDRSRRRYVTLQDIEDLVLGGKTVEVRDSRTGEDMTRQILTQILMERYPQKMDMFPVAMLHSVLRANDIAMDLWRGYLRQSLAAMDAWQKATSPFATPLDWVAAFLPGFGPSSPAPTAPAGAGGAGDTVAARLEELARRIEQLESRAHVTAGPGGGDPLDRLEQRVHELEDPPGGAEPRASGPNGREPPPRPRSGRRSGGAA